MFFSITEGFIADTYVKIMNTGVYYWQEMGWKQQNKAAELVKASGAALTTFMNVSSCRSATEGRRRILIRILEAIRLGPHGQRG